MSLMVGISSFDTVYRNTSSLDGVSFCLLPSKLMVRKSVQETIFHLTPMKTTICHFHTDFSVKIYEIYIFCLMKEVILFLA